MTENIQTSAPAAPHELILHRRSVRAFDPREVAEGEIVTLLEAARWAASCFNEQPWRYVVARRSDTDAYAKLLDCLVPANHSWAQHAPLLLLTLAKKSFTHNGTPNRFAIHDAGMALTNLMLQAEVMGMSAHAMGGFDAAKARETLAISDEYEIGAVVAVGYPGSPDSLPEKFRAAETAPRQRKPLEELVLSGLPAGFAVKA